MFYKITRQDGGFASGLKKLSERISEDLPLVENTFNFFTFSVFDTHNNAIKTDIETIGINSGFGISGQPLPEDICLEVDDFDNPGQTRLDLVFQKNTILPSKKTKTYSLNKTIMKSSTEDVIRINVLQGSQLALPESNKSLGYIIISGKELNRDISKGSDIEITISLSESQDLIVTAYLNMADQEFKQTFNPKERHTPIDILKEQVEELSEKLIDEIELATEREDYETAGALTKLKKEMESVSNETSILTNDDVTDKKYQLEDKKRKIAQEIDNATKHKRLQTAKDQYAKIKGDCFSLLEKSGNDYEWKSYNEIIAQEPAFMATNSPVKIQEKTDELNNIISQIRWRLPEFLTGIFNWLKSEQSKMNDTDKANELFEAGTFAIESQNWKRLREIDFGLLELLPKYAKDGYTTKIGFGL